MNVLSLGMGQKIFEEDSQVRERMIEYGRMFEELHIVVFSNKNHHLESRIKITENVFVYPTNSKSRVFYIFDYFKIVKNIINKNNKKDFVLSAQDPFEIGIVGLLLKFRFGLPLQVQIHTDFLNKYFVLFSPLNFIRVLVSFFTITFADGVRVVSNKIAKSINTLSSDISVLPVKIKYKNFVFEKKETRKENINILTVCRIEKEKDLATAIKAFKLVLYKFPKSIFTIVGDGGERKNLENLVQNLKIEKNVKFVGWQNDLENYYNNADIYISTSLYEGYGMSMVEAAFYSLPIVASRAGIAEDLLFENNEFIFEPKDYNRASVLLEKLIEDENLRLCVARNCFDSAKRFILSDEEYYKKYFSLLENTIKSAKNNTGIFKKNILIRYFICGIAAAALNILSLYVFTDYFRVWYLYSSVIAFLLSLIVSFILQKFVVFKDGATSKMHHQFFKFFVAAMLGVFTNTILVYLLTDYLNIWYVLSQIVAGFFVMIQNFMLYKFVIFQTK